MQESITLTKERRGKILLNTIFLGLILIYLAASYYILGKHDYLSIALWVFNFYIIFSKFYSIRSNLRSMTKANFNEDTIIYRFFNKKSVLQLFITIFFSAIMSLGFLITLKTLMLKHGVTVTLVALLIPSLILQLSNSKLTFSIEDQFKDNQGKQAIADLLEIWIKGFTLTVTIAIIFSILDTFTFYMNHLDLINFSILAEEKAIDWSESGKISRLPINLIIIQDSFSSALINQVLMSADIQKTALSPFWFWIITFIFSLFKLLPFSIAYLATILTIQNKAIDKTYLTFNQINKKYNTFRLKKPNKEQKDIKNY